MEDIMYSINRLLSITIGNNRAYLDVQYVNIAMLVWGCVFCLIAGVGMILSKNFDRRKRLWMILLQFATVVLLLSDAILKEKVSLEMLLQYYGVATIYINPKNDNQYYFDLDFLK